MASLLGRALAVPAPGKPPVPLNTPALSSMSTMALGGRDTDTYLRAFASTGTVWQIVHLLASSVAKPEWAMYKAAPVDARVRYTTSDQGPDQRVEVVKHAALSVLQRPNRFWSRFALMELSQTYMELAGEAFLVVERDPRATIPLGLWSVRPDRMQEVPDRERYLAGWVYTAPDGREQVPLGVDEVIHVKYPNPLNPYRGLGPVQAVLTDVDAAKYSAEWNRQYFLNSAEPGGIIQVPDSLDDDDFDTLMTRWRETHRGVSRAHRVAILEAGATWVPNPVSMKDMDFAALRNSARDLIREAWGVHKIMLGNTDDVNRANAQTGEEVYANWSIVPRLTRWRDAWNHQLLPMFGSAADGVEFDFNYPMPANQERDNAELTAKSQAAAVLVKAGFDPEDVLEVVGLPGMDFVGMPSASPSGNALPDGVEPAAEQEQEGQMRLREMSIWNAMEGAR